MLKINITWAFYLPVLDLEPVLDAEGDFRVRVRLGARSLGNSAVRVALKMESSELEFNDGSRREVSVSFERLSSRFGESLSTFLRLDFGAASSSSLPVSGTLFRFLDFVLLGSDFALSV
jgi:hypothetical protein